MLLKTFMPDNVFSLEHIRHSFKQEMSELYWFSAIKNFGVGLLGIFVPIYVYVYFDGSVLFTAMFYAAQFLLQIIFLPIAAGLFYKIGLKRLISISHPFLALYLLFLSVAPQYGIVALIGAIISKVTYFVLFWPAYHIDFAKFIHKNKSGKEIGFVNIVISVMRTIAPLLGGYMIVIYGFAPLFVISSVFMIVSAFPLFMSSEVYERYTMDWRKAISYLFRKQNINSTTAFFFEGVESFIGLFLFPAFIMMTIGEINTIGWITSLTLVFATITTYIVGRSIDKRGENKLMVFGSVFHSMAWLLQLLITTPIQYMVFNSIFRLASTANRLPYMSVSYKKAHMKRHRIDEFIITREISVNAGRLSMALLVIIGASLGFNVFMVSFVIASISALLFRMVGTTVSRL